MLKLSSASLTRAKPQALVIPVCEDDQIHDSDPLRSVIERARETAGFSGKAEDEVVFYAPSEVGAGRCLLMGLGKAGEVTAESLRAMAGNAVAKSIRMELSRILVAVPDAEKLPGEKQLLFEALLEGAFLSNHRFDRYKKDAGKRALSEIAFHVSRADAKRLADTVTRVETVCRGTTLARDWVSTPANDKRPERLARELTRAANEAGLKTRVLQEKELARRKFGAILAVGQGSPSRPRLILIEHRPRGAKKKVVLVGKGVTFDTGGINLKPSGSISDMKIDMAGAAAVAATLITAARLKLQVTLTGVIPIVENMPSGHATRPGDVITTYAGKTVEVGNTDAEGRLILCDAMAYAEKTYAPDVMVDLATLTGACIVALGEKIAGVFSRNDDLAETILSAGRATHERCWRLPLPEDYRELLKSDIADISNMSSSRYGGAVTAALFLSEFVSLPNWAHIDIAGPAHLKKAAPYCAPGGTGFGVRLLCRLLEHI